MHHKKVKILLGKVAASLEKGNQKATYLIDCKVGHPHILPVYLGLEK